jgi:hypothetical protein
VQDLTSRLHKLEEENAELRSEVATYQVGMDLFFYALYRILESVDR